MEQIKSLVEGGKATAGPPLGPALGPLGVPINDVVTAINDKTKDFKGMQVPVTVKVDPSTKDFEIEVGSPPVAALIKKELKIDKASGSAKEEMVANMAIEQVIKIAMMKEDTVYTQNRTGLVKTIIGSCISMGIMVEGKDPREIFESIDKGEYNEKIDTGKTELSDEEIKKLQDQQKEMFAELEKLHAAAEEKANTIMKNLEGKDPSEIRLAMKEEGIATAVINKLLPIGEVAEGGEGSAEEEKKEETPKEEKKEE